MGNELTTSNGLLGDLFCAYLDLERRILYGGIWHFIRRSRVSRYAVRCGLAPFSGDRVKQDLV